MEEIKKEGDKKSNATIILFAIILSLAIIGIIFWLVFKFLISGANDDSLPNVPFINMLEDRLSCRQDSDCVLVSKYYFNQYGQSSCCPMNCEQEAVNIETKIKEAAERDKLCATKDYQCPVSEQCVKQSLKEAVCEQSRCVAKEKTVNDNFNSNNNSAVESPTGIYLEQKEYEMGEKIIGAIRNSQDFDVFISNISIEKLSLGDCDASIGNVETKDCVQREWKIVKRHTGCRCGEAVECEGVNFKVLAHNIFEFNWNQGIDEIGSVPDFCKTAEVGKYRVKASYREVPNLPPGAKSEAQIGQTMYSKEFFIIDEAAEQSSNNNVNIGNGNYNNNNNSVNNSPDKYKIIGSLDSPGESSFVEKIGNIVFMTDISEGLLAIDVSNPKQPKLLSKLKIGGGGAYALAMDKIPSAAYALVSGYASTKVALVGISFENNSVKMEVIDEIDAKRSVQSIARSAHYAYLAIDGPEVEVLRIEKETSFPYKAKGLASKSFLNIGEGGHAIGVATPEGTAQLYTLAAAQGENGLGIYDLAQSESPALKFNISSIGYVNAAAISGDYAFVGAGDAVKIIDLKTQKEIGAVDAGGVWGLKIKDNLLYIASGEEGVKIFDVSDTNNPKQIAVVNTPGRARDFAIDGGYIYVADDRDDLQIIGKQ